MTRHHHHPLDPRRRHLHESRPRPGGSSLTEAAILWSARSLVVVLIGAGLYRGTRTAVFLLHSVPVRGHVVSRSSVTTYQPIDSRFRGLHFLPVTTSQVEVEFVDRGGVTRTQFVPESTCWGVRESDIPIRVDSSDTPHIRVDTFYSLWGGPTLALLAGVLIGALVEMLLR